MSLFCKSALQIKVLQPNHCNLNIKKHKYSQKNVIKVLNLLQNLPMITTCFTVNCNCNLSHASSCVSTRSLDFYLIMETSGSCRSCRSSSGQSRGSFIRSKMLEGIKVLTRRRPLTAEVKPHRRNPIADATLNTYEVFSAPSQVWLSLKSKQPELLKCTQPARQIAGLVLYFTQLYFIYLSGPSLTNRNTLLCHHAEDFAALWLGLSQHTPKLSLISLLIVLLCNSITTFTYIVSGFLPLTLYETWCRSALCPSRLLFGFKIPNYGVESAMEVHKKLGML